MDFQLKNKFSRVKYILIQAVKLLRNRLNTETVHIPSECDIAFDDFTREKGRVEEIVHAVVFCVSSSNYSPFANDLSDSRNPLVWKLVPRSRLITISRAT